MNIHEYQAKQLLRKGGVPVPEGVLVTDPAAVRGALMSLGAAVVVVKAQIHSGGRGLAGGVKLAQNAVECEDIVKDLLGKTLVTRQTGPRGKKVRKLYIEAASDIVREYYLALTLDRERAAIDVVFTTQGGMDIEEVAAKHPDLLSVVTIDVALGVRDFHLRNLLECFGLAQDERQQIGAVIRKAYRIFLDRDCSLIEINPLAVNATGRFFALDAKMSFDDNALFRQPEVSSLRDLDEEDPRETEANQFGLNYVALDGDIACMVNGAGLAMATMDAIKLFGGEPANFLDVGGGASQEAITAAFRILTSDASVKGIFVNIFGGIMKCDLLAAGILEASSKVQPKVPVVVRLSGTNAAQGKKMLAASSLALIPVDDMAVGARRIVELVAAQRRGAGG